MSIIIFYVSLILIILMLSFKHYGIKVFKHEAIAEIVSKNEKHIHRLAGTGKELASKIHFENLQKLVVRSIGFIKKESIILKRRFDSKQPKFLLKTEPAGHENKHSVSFFLKNISEHNSSSKKKNL